MRYSLTHNPAFLRCHFHLPAFSLSGFSWTYGTAGIVLSSGGLVASVVDESDSDYDSASDDDADFTRALNGCSYKMTTDGGEHMQTGRHYWEVEITACDNCDCDMLLAPCRATMQIVVLGPSQAACCMHAAKRGWQPVWRQRLPASTTRTLQRACR